jgi:MFS family permease
MKISEQQKLTKEQKEAIGLLSIGTFLEYFDLMLYVHMAVLLNELFFPKTDPNTASLITAFSFCSIFVFRPFGALLLGYLSFEFILLDNSIDCYNVFPFILTIINA